VTTLPDGLAEMLLTGGCTEQDAKIASGAVSVRCEGAARSAAGIPTTLFGSLARLCKNGAMERQPMLTARERQEEANRFTASLAGLAAALLLGLIGLWVADGLAQVSKLEDCLLQSRMNCERVELSPAP
jgi:hypothetical protein